MPEYYRCQDETLQRVDLLHGTFHSFGPSLVTGSLSRVSSNSPPRADKAPVLYKKVVAIQHETGSPISCHQILNEVDFTLKDLSRLA